MEEEKIDKTKEFDLTPKEALTLACIAVMSVDGSVEDDELKVVNRIIQGDHIAFLKAFEVYNKIDALDSVNLACEILTPDQILFAITNFLDLVMADGILSESEEKLIQYFLEKSGLPGETLEKIEYVLNIKNNFSLFE